MLFFQIVVLVSLTPNGDNTVFTATLVPDGEGQCTVDVAADVFTDAFGNTNTAATYNLYGRSIVFTQHLQ